MRRRDQQGAVAVMMALVICFVLIPMAALAVDIGVQRVARRDMQAVADVVALDLSRQLTGGTYGSYTASKKAALQTIAEESRDRNATNVGSGSGGKSADISYELGTVDNAAYGTASYFTPTTASNVIPTAVRVKATATVGFGLANALPGDGFGSGSATRYAIGVSQSSACFYMGSFAAAINTAGSTLLGPLNKLLGLNLGLISYQGLAAANLNLLDLAADAHIGSVNALLAGNVTLGNFTAATIAVLQKENNPGNAAAITALQAIQASGINLSKKVDVLKMINLQSTDTAALESDINVLDLIASAVQVANGDHAVDVSSLNIAGITGDIKVTEGIRRACGAANSAAARATSSQIKANLTVPLTFPSGNSVLGLSVGGSVTVSGGVGNATGQLVAPPSVVCNSGTPADPDTYRVDVNGGLLGLGVQANLTLNGTVTTGLLGGLLDSLLGVLVKVQFTNVTVSLGTSAPGTSSTVQHADLRWPQNKFPGGTAVATGSAYGGLTTVPSLTTATAVGGTISITTNGLLGLGPTVVTNINLSRGGGVGTLLNTLLGTVNGVLTNTVNSAVVPTLNGLLSPLAKLLGLNAGGADVYAGGETERPTCNGAKLAG